VYETTQELLREIEAGEDSLLDFKDVTRRGHEIRFAAGEGPAAQELAKDLTCFANTEGGVIVFGVRRDGERTGLSEDALEPLQQLIVNVAQNNVEPSMGHLLLFDRVRVPDRAGAPRLLLRLEIKKALFSVHAPRGRRPYRRIADHCHEMTLDEQARLMERRGMMAPFEERPLFRAPLEAIERDRIAKYYERRYGGRLEDGEIPYDRLLLNLHLASADESGAVHPTALGVLFFASRPDDQLAGAYVDIAAYRGTVADADQQRDAKAVHGPVPEQIEHVMSYLRTSPLVPVAATKDDRGRRDEPAYSLRALQEAVVNALVHRDYSVTGAQVRVWLFEDRIEIANPGGLHNTLTVEALFDGCQPVRRNQMLVGFLREYESPLTGRSYMEGRGEGFLAMVRECQRVTGRKPEVAVVADSVRVTMRARADVG